MVEFVLLTIFVVGTLAVIINNRKKQDVGMFDVWCILSVYVTKGCPDCRLVDEQKACPLGQL